MKKLIIFIIILTCSIAAFAQKDKKTTMENPNLRYSTEDFAKDWSAIDSLQNNGLPKSALELLDVFEKKIKGKNNPAQEIKCILYRQKFFINTSDKEGNVDAIKNIEEQISKSDFPVKPILQSMLAEIYDQYRNNNQYNISSRTNTADFKNTDVQTWSNEQFTQKVNELYLESTKDKRSKEISIDNFKAITLGEDVKYRPTLFDFLAFRAIEYFKNGNSMMIEPNYIFQIKEENALKSATEFLKYKPVTKDEKSYKLQVIKLLQEVIAFHIEDENPYSYLDADLIRLSFVYENSAQNDKDKTYLATLDELLKKYEMHPLVTEIYVLKATYFFNKHSQEKPNNEEERLVLVKAAQICKECIEKNQNKKGFDVSACQKLYNTIVGNGYAYAQIEENHIPNRPILVQLNYKNTKDTKLKIVKLTTRQKDQFLFLQNFRYQDDNDSKLRVFIQNLPVVLEKNFDLPATDDYRNHSTEVKLDGLAAGEYAIFEAIDENREYLKFFNVSNLAHFTRINHEGNNEILVVNRITGEPIPNVVAEIFNYRNDEGTNTQKKVKVGNAVGNINGFINPKVNTEGSYSVRLHWNNDTLEIGDQYYSRFHREQNRTYQTTSFFLDRAIYRPGQSVFFKGIALSFDKKNMPSILKNENVRVVFHDVNGQEVAVQNLRTNEYGTFNGEFTTPTSGLLGQMNISSSIGGNAVYFRVEEYKRPKFEVVFKPTEGSFKINDEVKVVGFAKSFAGSNIDGAKVKYRVTREVDFPFWRYSCWWRPAPVMPSMEIINGETTTKTDGTFDVFFKAIPDETTDLKDNPEFSYTVYADVVDINGETHSQQTSVKVGTIAIKANVDLKENYSANQFKKLKISTLNLNGQPEGAKGTVKIQLLKSPAFLYKNRYWDAPDKPSLSRTDFERFFPDLPFDNEDKVENWKVKQDILTQFFDTEKNTEIDLSKTSWKSGKYCLLIDTKDKFGTPIQLKEFFTIYEPNTKIAPANIPSFVMLEKNILQPGDTARIFVGSAYENIKVLFEIIRDNKIEVSKWVTINNLGELKFKIEESDRGGMHTQITYVKENRVYLNQFIIDVPWKNKELNIDYQSFRDKLLPGQEEEWRIKISGEKKDKIAAEMVATLYDASLDQFAKNNFNLMPFPSIGYNPYGLQSNFGIQNFTLTSNNNDRFYPNIDRNYKHLNWFDFPFSYYPMVQAEMTMAVRGAPMMAMADSAAPAGKASSYNVKAKKTNAKADDTDKDGIIDKNGGQTVALPYPESILVPNDPIVTPRTNLKETVFFLPNLMTDADGNVIIKFRMNEALTKWRFLALAHTKDLKIGKTEKEIVTQKDLMVLPNPPRFMREGDSFYFSTKITNMTDKDMSGKVKLELFDALTDKPCDDLFENKDNSLTFNVLKGQSTSASWKLNVPFGKISALTWRVTAFAGNQSDGEQNALPILTNRMLVTETMPLPVRGGQTREFNFEAMQKASASTTLQHHDFVLEFTQNPAWYAVQALPYLMEYPYECTEQVFSRYYANTLATSVVKSTPKIQAIFEKWKNQAGKNNDTDAFISNLAKNQALKSAILEETPWVMASCNEEQQRKNIALLFDLNRMSNELTRAIDKIVERQLPSGGFTWFPGAKENWYITQYLAEGFGHLKTLKADLYGSPKMETAMQNAVVYIDKEMLDEYNRLAFEVKEKRAKWEDNHLGGMQIHYLYTRSFYKNTPMREDVKKAYEYYLAQAEKFWVKQGIYYEGMIALTLHRNDKKDVSQIIVKSLRERSINNEELGMYWKNEGGYYWYQMPIETHSLMIEVFSEVGKDTKAVEDLKTWLLKNKQTNAWKTTKATASAVYALLLNGENWIAEDKPLKITIANQPLDLSKIPQQEGSGYFKKSFFENGKPTVNDVLDLAKIKVENPNKVPAWGAMYWQYFENLDEIKDFKATPLTIAKQLFREENSDKGLIIKPISEKTPLSPGDKLKVRIELRVDRDMEYVHMKDMRAAGFEPTNVLSQYKWQGGLGYYESTKDAATNFFFDYLPKGTYVFEYPLVINQKGDFSNGITTIQCMYAPEFSSHSEGIRVNVR